MWNDDFLQTRVSEKSMKLFSQCTDHKANLLQVTLAFSQSILRRFYNIALLHINNIN